MVRGVLEKTKKQNKENKMASRKFRVEHKDWEKKPLTITLFNPPYEDENILAHTGWKSKDVTITEMKAYRIEEQFINISINSIWV